MANSFHSSAAIEKNNGILQTKHNYLTVEFPKITDETLAGLLYELNSYEGKVVETIYTPETRRLLIYYTSLMSLDDLLYVISKHTLSFTKIGGTELE